MQQIVSTEYTRGGSRRVGQAGRSRRAQSTGHALNLNNHVTFTCPGDPHVRSPSPATPVCRPVNPRAFEPEHEPVLVRLRPRHVHARIAQRLVRCVHPQQIPRERVKSHSAPSHRKRHHLVLAPTVVFVARSLIQPRLDRRADETDARSRTDRTPSPPSIRSRRPRRIRGPREKPPRKASRPSTWRWRPRPHPRPRQRPRGRVPGAALGVERVVFIHGHLVYLGVEVRSHGGRSISSSRLKWPRRE